MYKIHSALLHRVFRKVKAGEIGTLRSLIAIWLINRIPHDAESRKNEKSEGALPLSRHSQGSPSDNRNNGGSDNRNNSSDNSDNNFDDYDESPQQVNKELLNPRKAGIWYRVKPNATSFYQRGAYPIAIPTLKRNNSPFHNRRTRHMKPSHSMLTQYCNIE